MREPQRLHVIVRGRVQGVGFRAATADMARSLGLRGWARNLPSGEVEIEMEGPKATLEEALRWCAHGPRFARVDTVDATWHTTLEGHDAFNIRH